MKEPREDDERLSALLEGRVEARQRDDLLAHLSAADDDYEVFTDTAEVLRALEEEEEDARVAREATGVSEAVHAEEGDAAPAKTSGIIPFPHAERTRRRRQLRWLGMAASVVGIVVISRLALPERASAAGTDPVLLAARLDTKLPAGWATEPPWIGERGDGTGTDRRVRAVRAGVLMMDLSVAARAGDKDNIELLAGQLSSRFGIGPAASRPFQQIAARPGAPPDSLTALLKQATENLEDRLKDERDYMHLGAWAEAARLATQARDEAFFEDGTTREMLNRAERLTRDNATARAAVDGIHEAALPAQGPPDWGSLMTGLETLLSTLAS